MTAELPLVLELRPPPDVESALLQIAAQPHSLFLDSAARDPRLGRYSFLTADPFDFFTVSADGTDGLALLDARLRSWQSPARPDLAPQFTVPGPPGLTSNFAPDAYRAAIQRAIDYIYAGDVFQVNLAQRLLFPAAGDALSLYLRLRQCNPAPFAGWFDIGSAQIVSASPERFLSVRGGNVEARPIKG